MTAFQKMRYNLVSLSLPVRSSKRATDIILCSSVRVPIALISRFNMMFINLKGLINGLTNVQVFVG